MPSKPDPLLFIALSVEASHPRLLEGLDVWLRLGLMSDAQVKQLSKTYLTCLVPVVVAIPKPQLEALPSDIDWESDIQDAEILTPSPVAQMWQSLWDELSVRWLLFLGVFLVVVSSGVLAATQWQNFPGVAQYGVLWAYTVIFWGGSVWALRQQSLQLTAQTLRLITLLLMPVNFWAMDSFGLWRNPLEWVVMAIAAVTLTTITLLQQELRNIRSRFASNGMLLLGLSFLHWGWHGLGFPLIAVYLGMVGTAIFLPRIALQPITNPQSLTVSQEGQVNQTIGNSIVIYALTVLLGRGIFVVHLPIPQLGLAIGICGWLFARLSPANDTAEVVADFKSRIWETTGAGLLLVGWLVSVSERLPWQAAAVSGLGLWFCGSRLRRLWRRLDVLLIFLIGLQEMVLLWRLIPAGFRKDAIANFTQLTHSQSVSWALPSVGLFPYVILMIVLVDWLYRASKPQLASFGEQLIFSFGAVLTEISLANPVLRSLNLVLSTLTLAALTFRWLPTRKGLVYLTHVTGLFTFASIIDWLFPNLSQLSWAVILLVSMVIEWGFSSLKYTALRRLDSANSSLSIWQESSWHLGFVLSGISYALLFNYVYPNGVSTSSISLSNQLVLFWFLTPLALTGVASLSEEEQRKQSALFSIVALGMAQILTITLPETRLVSLGIATGLMLVNTRYRKQLDAAVINVGFGLTLVGMLLWQGIPGLPRLSTPDWFLVNAIAIIILWLLRSLLQQLPGRLAALYAQASDNWAIGLCSVELVMLTFQNIGSYRGYIAPDDRYLAASILIVIAIVYRCWRQPNNFVVCGFSWAVEIIVAEAILLTGGKVLDLAVANIILGLITLFVSDAWAIRYRRSIPLRSVEILPLFYGLLALILRVGYFNNWTGLLTLGASLIGIGMGRRRAEWKLITYLSLGGITVAWYELVIYQLLQAKEGRFADGLTILASVATAIAICYRLLAWFWRLRSRETLLSLSLAEIKITAHLHWFIGSVLMGLAVQNAISIPPKLTTISIIVSLILASYALLQGRCQDITAQKNTDDIWVYLGLIEIAGTIFYARIIWTELSDLDPHFSTIAYLLAYGMHQIPWQHWGWRRTPWRLAAIVFPLLIVLATASVVSDLGLLGVAAFYIWVSQLRSNFQFTYISVALIDWAILRWFDRINLTDSLWYTIVVGLSLLYVAQFDPELKKPEKRQLRHYLRLIGSGAISFVALVNHQDTGLTPGLIPGIISFITIFAGLILRVRAFLFVGTATFLLTAFYQLVILISRHPFIKWIIGLIAGIVFIGMAANFETRREQIKSVLRNSRNQLGEWE
jgi:hypothetical protein